MDYGIASPSYIDAWREVQAAEAAFVTQEALARTLTGSGPEIIERLEGMGAAGIDNVAISVTGPRRPAISSKTLA